MNIRPLRPDQKDRKPTRWSYQDSSENFVGWVNSLGIEKTLLGQALLFLDQKIQLKRGLLLLIYFIGISFFISWELDRSFSGYKEGDLAVSDLRSPMTLSVIDEEQTALRKRQAEESIPPLYDYDVGSVDRIIADFRQTMRRFRSKAGDLSDFQDALGRPQIPRSAFLWLQENGFRTSIEAAVVRNLEKWQGLRILEDYPSGRSGRLIARLLEDGGRGEEFLVDVSSVVSVSEVRRQLDHELIKGPLSKVRDLVHLREFVKSLVIANFSLNKHETEERRRLAREGVEEARIQVRKGQVIVRQGAPLGKTHLLILDELAHRQVSKKKDFVSLMTAFFLFVIVICFFVLADKLSGGLDLERRDFISLGITLFLVIAMAKVAVFLGQSVFVARFPQIHSLTYFYLAPLASGAMIIGLTAPRIGVLWLYSMVSSLALGLIIDRSLSVAIVAMAANLMGGRWVQGCSRRSDFYVAGIKTGLISSAMILLSQLMVQEEAVSGAALAFLVGAGFFGGLFSSLLTLILIPLWESVFVYTTDVRLLELSNLNHPLLKDMIVKAPGTYHHSLVVGNMCEAAAESIGANPLLAKVCAYYHDIGKTPHAQYFIENQRPGENRHDQLSPAMSKTILVAHVKDGVELAHKYKLGGPIIDVIEQHHGTTLISFFYHKAKEFEDSEMHEFSENEFRYPGPRPQTREAALCMLADSIEAAARTLDEPTPARLQNIVRTIVQRKFQDGQLDECRLTLRDLSQVEEAFSRILMGIYHQRIDYPTATPSGSKKAQNGNPQ
ncbi:MAG: HDIG domain-containing protein [Oligoflexia bacterium]|nr:HDIG domain-containing protein [Oligoflexia bacterium]